jgi:hypothetical protein
MARSSAQLLDAQEQAWRSLEQTAVGGIRQLLDEAGERMTAAIGGSLDTSLGRWGESLARAHDELASRREERWTGAAESLAEAVRGLERHQRALTDQTAMLGSVVDATRDISMLERSLDANLSRLATTGRFEETLATLAAAVQLLAARAGDVAGDPRRIDLHSARSTGKAA